MSQFEYRVWKRHSPNPNTNSWRHEILIEGQSISAGYKIDFDSLARSFENPGDYFVLTCSCGEPGCAGLNEPFHVSHLGDGIIHWHIEQPIPEREYYFSAKQAIHSILKGLRILNENQDPRFAIGRETLNRFERLEIG